ncbi:MAG: hypothetical protein LRZ84_14780 [Desertifilum sp.]|nr:hypothetical protein [Desertifilum sp.]
MPCLDKEDLSHLANAHIESQKGVIRNQRNRLDKIYKQMESATGQRLKELTAARDSLEFHLNGKVTNESGEFETVNLPAEKRLEAMAHQYKNSAQFTFRDYTKNEHKPRTASVFGLPTVEEMLGLNRLDIAHDIIIRALSLATSKKDAVRNPVHYLDDKGMQVKDPLASSVEHHHIYNNVKLDENGRVKFKSVKFRYNSNTGDLKLDIVPSYWNSEENGRNTQFIGLLDGMHSGADPVTHLHFYEFDDNESVEIIEKIRDNIPQIKAEAAKSLERKKKELAILEARISDPETYEANLKDEIAKESAVLEDLKLKAKGLTSKAKKDLEGEALERREAFDQQKSKVRALNTALGLHQEILGIHDEIRELNNKYEDMLNKSKGINLRTIKDPIEREAKKNERNNFQKEAKDYAELIKDKNKTLKSKGDLNALADKAKSKIDEFKKLAELTEESAVELFHQQNGFFSFDKGSEEKADHDTYKPGMNAEITYYYAREALNHLKTEYGDNALNVAQTLARQSYKSNLLYRLKGLHDKIKGNLPGSEATTSAKSKFSAWGGDGDSTDTDPDED